MQTFLPYPDFIDSARVLDNQRLGKQRVEAKQIYLALTEPNYGWKNHPATKMWRGYESGLAAYGYFICEEWRKRGFKDSLLSWFEERCGDIVIPDWVGSSDFHASHKSNLIRKLPERYRSIWPDLPDDLPYVWPV